MKEVEVDHLRCLLNPTYRARTHARLVRLAIEERGKVASLAVIHEHDNRCCRREDWSITLRKLIAAEEEDE
ncbi:hypothetical protein [Candidatus Nephthysia bennettiae]|uniref:Uncharacterized protein n=1 Tax=Candidatus Nephthysia bennettiae TaxID=3127016 RepID=A0A934K691_9BACT|nr:hypothetical protein [Candidatus Dormibacteraeota bacterium]